MSLIGLIVVLVVVGVLLYVVNTYIPMDAKIKNILNIAVVVVVVTLSDVLGSGMRWRKCLSQKKSEG